MVMDKAYPSRVDDEGGVSVPHIPTDEEMGKCAFAQRAGTSCLRRDPWTKEIADWITCLNCFLYPTNGLGDRFFIKAERQPILR